MKRLFCLMLVLCLLLAGCGKKEAAAPTEPATEAPTTVATEAPTTEATEAPTEETEPTTEATTVPTTMATTAPTTEATTMPTTRPTTDSTEATMDNGNGPLPSDNVAGTDGAADNARGRRMPGMN